MANTSSARKKAKQDVVRAARNKAARSKMRTAVRGAVETIDAKKDQPSALSAFKNAMSALHQAVTKGIMKKRTASRKISRLNARLKKSA